MHVEPSKAAPRRRKALLRVFIAALALVVAVGTVELALRCVLSSDGIGWRLRKASLYADPRSDDDFWKLQRQFRSEGERDGFARRDAKLGWIDVRIEPGTYAHIDEARVGARRPVLLFGDSYAACVTPREECWEGLVDADLELSETHALVNYGTAAFGVDQAFVLLREALPRWKERDPLVVFAIFVDDDLDRCALTFRGCPKPWFEVRGDGELVEHTPPDDAIDAYVAEHPIEISSYLARLVLTRFPGLSSALPSSLRPPHELNPALVERKQRVVRALLVELRALVDATSTDACVVLFHGERSLSDPSWRHTFLVETLEELELPYVSSRELLLAHPNRAALFANDHYTAEGNRVVYPMLARAIRQR